MWKEPSLVPDDSKKNIVQKLFLFCGLSCFLSLSILNLEYVCFRNSMEYEYLWMQKSIEVSQNRSVKLL